MQIAETVIPVAAKIISEAKKISAENPAQHAIKPNKRVARNPKNPQKHK